jgi:hypothetical protein
MARKRLFPREDSVQWLRMPARLRKKRLARLERKRRKQYIFERGWPGHWEPERGTSASVWVRLRFRVKFVYGNPGYNGNLTF